MTPSPESETMTMATPTFTTTGYIRFCPLVNGTDVLRAYGFHTEFWYVWRNFAILIGFAIFFVIVYAIMMLVFHHHEPHRPRDKEVDDVETNAKLPECAPLPLLWRDVSYAVEVDGGWKDLLSNVSGFAVPGTITALMGESGAGKTTLMDVVAHRKQTGIAKGVVYLGASDVSLGTGKAAGYTSTFCPEASLEDDENVKKLLLAAAKGDAEARKKLQSQRGKRAVLMFKGQTGYVLQFDTLCSFETVREAIEFSAALRVPDLSSKERKSRIDEVIKLLALENVQHRQIGGVADNLPGITDSERKLTGVAVELVANPPVLFLDEPTTGLDPQGALVVVEALRRIADAGRAVVATIHQPSTALFASFDRLLLLRRGGKTVYFGPLHSTGPGTEAIKPFITSIDGKGGSNGGKNGKAAQHSSSPAALQQSASGAEARKLAQQQRDFAVLKRYFEVEGSAEPCGQQNPATWMLKVIDAAGDDCGTDFARVWKKSALGRQAQNEVDAMVALRDKTVMSADDTARLDVFSIRPALPKPAEDEVDPKDAAAKNPQGACAAGGCRGGGAQAAGYPGAQAAAGNGAYGVYGSNRVGQYGEPLDAEASAAMQLAGFRDPILMADSGEVAREAGKQTDDTDTGYKRAGPAKQFVWCMLRLGRMHWRATSYNRRRIIITILLAFILGVSFYDMCECEAHIGMRLGFVFTVFVFVMSITAAMALPFWFNHRPCFYRECHGSGMYSPWMYGICMTILEIPFLVLSSFIFGIITFYLSSLSSRADVLFIYILHIFITIGFGTWFGQMLVFAMDSILTAQALFGLIMPAFSLMNGFILRRDLIPRLWIWLYWAAPARWLFESVFINLFEHVGPLECPGTNRTADPMVIVNCPWNSGPAVIDDLRLYDNMMWPDVAIIFGYIFLVIFFRMVAMAKKKPTGV